MLKFLRTKRIFRADLNPFLPIAWSAEILGLAFAFGAWLGWQNLAPFRNGAPIVTVSLNEFALIGCVGFYGFRIAIWIAAIRKSRMPQTVEWIVGTVPPAIALLMLILSGPIERVYAAAHGYHYCSAVAQRRSTDYRFAAATAKCPPEPVSPPWHKPEGA